MKVIINDKALTEEEVLFVEMAILRFQDELTGNVKELEEIGEVMIERYLKIAKKNKFNVINYRSNKMKQVNEFSKKIEQLESICIELNRLLDIEEKNKSASKEVIGYVSYALDALDNANGLLRDAECSAKGLPWREEC